MPVYNKLVRDRIPEIIKNTGQKPITKYLEQNEYIEELKKKFLEEFEEYRSAQSDEEALEELADVLEILHALADIHGASIEKVEHIRKEKAEKRGGFQKKIYLVEVQDE